MSWDKSDVERTRLDRTFQLQRKRPFNSQFINGVIGIIMKAGRSPRFYLGTGDSEPLSPYKERSPLSTVVTTLLDHRYGLARSRLLCLSYIKMLHLLKLVEPTVPRIAAHSIHGNLPQLTNRFGGLE